MTQTTPADGVEGLRELLVDVPETWRQHGYASPAAEIADMSNVGRSFMERYGELVKDGGQFAGWMPLDDPAEFVTHLADRQAEAAATLAALRAEVEEGRRVLEPFARVAEAVEEFDPTYPDEGAALRASFDWFDSRSGAEQSLRFKSFRAARAFVGKGGGHG